MATKRIKDLTTDKYTGYAALDDSNGTGKFPIGKLIESIAPVFDPTVNYTVGQSVMYQGAQYTFKVNHPAGVWNPSHVDATNVQDYIGHCPTATESDLVSGKFLEITGPNDVKKKLPANLVPANKIIDRGEASVGYINGLTFQLNGWKYTLANNGTITAGGLIVEAGDVIAWNASLNQWYFVNHRFATKSSVDALNGSTINLIGNGNTAVVSDRFEVFPGCTYIIDVPNGNWNDSEIVSDDSFKFAIRYYDDDQIVFGNNLVSVYKGGTVNSRYVVKFPNNARGGDFFIRANAGVTVSLCVKVDLGFLARDLNKILYTFPAEKMESGNVNMLPTSMTYTLIPEAHRYNRALFRDGVFLDAKAGDIVGLYDTSNMSYYIAYSSDGQVPYTVKGWLKNKFVFEDDCKFLILTKTDDATALDYAEFAKNLFFVTEQHDLIESSNNLNEIYGKIGTLGNRPKSFHFEGAGGTALIYQFDVAPNSCLRVNCGSWTYTAAHNNKLCVRYYDSNDSSFGHNIVAYMDTDTIPSEFIVSLPEGYTRFDLFLRCDLGESGDISVSAIDKEFYPLITSKFVPRIATSQCILKGVNHRGYNPTCPENTLPAFRESARRGFKYVETDIQLTSDDVWVCIHDDTIDRTSNGSGYVSSYTYDQLKAFDFGSWKGAQFTGVTIPSLEEFIQCCKRLGLKCYIELKSGISQLGKAVDIVKANGMEKDVTWISFYSAMLESVKTLDQCARLGYIVNTIDSTAISTAAALRNQYNEVFIDAEYNVSNISSPTIALLKQSGMPVEFWTVNFTSDITGIDPYTSGITSDYEDASIILYETEINAPNL